MKIIHIALLGKKESRESVDELWEDGFETNSSGGTNDGANAEDKKAWPITDTEATQHGRED